jgi:hypothetical protein
MMPRRDLRDCNGEKGVAVDWSEVRVYQQDRDKWCGETNYGERGREAEEERGRKRRARAVLAWSWEMSSNLHREVNISQKMIVLERKNREEKEFDLVALEKYFRGNNDFSGIHLN